MNHLPSAALLAFLVFSTSTGLGVESKRQNASPKPLVRWTFEKMPDGKAVGRLSLDSSGPAAPEYPDFGKTNSALSLAAPAYVRIADPKDDDPFDFENGDVISVEAWVNLKSIDQHAYIIGKGRTRLGGQSNENQNWAVRLSNQRGSACVNFLFRSRGDDSQPSQWHRWTSTKGFAPGSDWHHVAIVYKFGKPDSVKGYLDGEPVPGKWDMDGPTDRAPVVDEDEVWIGSSMGGSKSCSLNGQIDELCVYREELPAKVIASRFRYVPQPLKIPEIAERQVLTQLFGPFESHSGIPRHVKDPVAQWNQTEMAFIRLPKKYDDWGVRDQWTQAKQRAMLLRAWTRVALPPGDYQWLVRSRGFSRLMVDGKPVANTPAQPNRGGAHHKVDPIPSVPLVGMRPHFMSDHERIVDFHSDGATHLVMYEAIVGGPNYRLELGENCVAIAPVGKMFQIVSASREYELTDFGWQRLCNDQNAFFDSLDRNARRSAAAKQDGFWKRRHAYAASHLIADNPKSSESKSSESESSESKSRDRSDAQHAANKIDRLIEARIEHENARRTQAHGGDPTDTRFADQIEPIFAAHCARCHSEKKQGDLSVTDRESLLTGGESGDPAIVPGKPDESLLMELVAAGPDDYRMPPKGDGLSKKEIEAVRQWIAQGAAMPKAAKVPLKITPALDDYTFLRRVFIDTIGLTPTLAEIDQYFGDPQSTRRQLVVDRLLNDPRWADNWVGYWQDILAENPNLLKPTLNNTGPFRYWILDALQDNKPIDRFATELILMRGSQWYGGAAGFGIASQNDVPMAAKAHVISSAFLGVDLQCARCHDAPYHAWLQSDLFQMAAMLERKAIDLPETSTVPAAFFEKQARKPLIDVTLKPGATIEAQWPLSGLSQELPNELMLDPQDSRERLAAHVTASRRFAEVIANRIWQRLMGAGIVQPVDDWEGNPPCDPALLETLADHLIENRYDQKRLMAAIFLSKAYSRTAVDADDDGRFFTGPYRRRMSAEQIVDSSLHAVGLEMRTEQLTMDIEGTLPEHTFINFGFPQRAWEFTTLANERDRPSLALPRAQAIVDVLKAFGWRNSRPEPTSRREEAPNLIQPGVLANGTLGTWLTRLSDEHAITALALQDQPLDQFIDGLFLRLLTRKPSAEERERFTNLLAPGYDDRRAQAGDIAASEPPEPAKRFRYVSWSNHLNTEANVIKVEMEALARSGDPPTQRLTPAWRIRAEDAVWALLNGPEMILVP